MIEKNKEDLMQAHHVYVDIKTRYDEKKWKKFLSTYFPNHYAKEILKKDLKFHKPLFKKYYRGHSIGISPVGYGYISGMCIHYGSYLRVDDFEEFKLTKCYQDIISNGISLGEGEVEIIKSSLPDK